MIDMTLEQHDAFERNVDGLMQLAVKAGYTDNMPYQGGNPLVMTSEMRTNLTRFAIAILADLYGSGRGVKIQDVMLERIVEIAVKVAGHTAVENIPLTDIHAVVKASAMEVFFVRFAYQIAAEKDKQK